MGKIFNYDSKFFAGMTKVSDTIIINILFVKEYIHEYS